MSGFRHLPRESCPHLQDYDRSAKSDRSLCQECDHDDDLRLCLACGHVGCCESHRAHNTAHFKETGHALIRAHRCGYDWVWCYECQAYLG
ncbi:MAG TPA: UBP-type zinc finger domain-containing protein [Candidatus Polarisedimenticolaceae bacterium]|nr:UBP-type zinc finger domain-containing protein [Candidatus Polarisedimenticolaceae bacterium]